MVKQQDRFVLSAVHAPSQEPPEEELLGYPVHVLCWEMLSHHSVLGSIAKTDLEAVLDILRRKCREWEYGTGNTEADSTFMEIKGRYINGPGGT